MADELVSAILESDGIRVLVAVTGELSRHARTLHKMEQGSGALLAQGMTAAALLAALQKDNTRLHLQLECDGPLRGLFADATSDGFVRGYVKNSRVLLPAATAEFRWRPVLGNSGFLSVLREQGSGEFYRSSVELKSFELGQDLASYFASSDQVESAVDIQLIPQGAEPLGLVAGLLLQQLPGGKVNALEALRERLVVQGGFRQTLEKEHRSAKALASALLPDSELHWMNVVPLQYRCGCSRERVENALLAMGKAELEDLLQKTGHADVDCEFCTTHYHVSGDDIRKLLKDAGN